MTMCCRDGRCKRLGDCTEGKDHVLSPAASGRGSPARNHPGCPRRMPAGHHVSNRPYRVVAASRVAHNDFVVNLRLLAEQGQRFRLSSMDSILPILPKMLALL